MSSINNRINSKAEQRLREKEFPLKIKKREKELLLEEAHSKVRKELNPSLKNIKVGISFSEYCSYYNSFPLIYSCTLFFEL